MSIRWVCLAFAVAGCVESAALECGDLTCPASHICIADENRCVPEDAIANCANKDEGTDCEAGGLGGVCKSGVCEVVLCGNGIMERGEACDDNNVTPGDGCNASCLSDETCGNGFVDPDEKCDCGDGGANHANPSCDEQNSEADSATCHTDCTLHRCGDGAVEPGELCEIGVTLDSTCATFGYYQGSLGCTSGCQYDVSGCSAKCGDGIVNGSSTFTELCDPMGPAPTESCLDFGYDAGPLGCTTFCTPAFDSCDSIGWAQHPLDSSGFLSVWGSSPTDVWGGGDAKMLHWNGATWSSVTIPGASGFVEGIWGASATNIYAAVGSDIAHYNGSAWSIVATAPGPLKAISGFGPDRIVAVGDGGIIYSWNGSAWQTHTGATEPLLGVYVVSATEAYAVGNNEDYSFLYRWTGGTTWTAVTPPPIRYLTAVWGTGTNNVYIAGSSIMRWDGTNWSAIALGLNTDYLSVSGSGPNDIFATTSGAGGIVHFDGSAWSLLDTDGLAYSDVWSGGNGYAFAAGTRMARYLGTAWSGVRALPRSRINGIAGSATGLPLAVGGNGLALAYDGSFWRTIPGSQGADYHAASRAVAVGDFGYIGSFNGTRMVQYPSGTLEHLHAVWAASDTDAWAVGDSGVATHFTGASATPLDSTTFNSLYAIWGFATNNIYAAGYGGKIVRYTGASWSNFTSPTTDNINAMWGTPSGDVCAGCFMIVGDNGTVHRWTGSAWEAEDGPPTNASLTGVYAISSNDVMVAEGTTRLWRWTGAFGGVSGSGTWTPIDVERPTTTIGAHLGARFSGGPNFALARSPNFATWVPQTPDFDAAGQYAFRSVYAASESDVYAVNSSMGRVAHFDGQLWTFATVTAPNASTVTGADSSNVFAFGSGTNFNHWNGATWLAETAPSSPYMYAGHAFDATHVFAVGSQGAIRHYTGSWATSTSNTSEALFGVWMPSATEAFAVGDAATILHYTGGAWAPMTTTIANTVSIWDVWGTSATNVWAVGEQGTVAHFTGSQWSLDPGPGTATLYSVWGTAANDVFATGEGGTAIHFDGTRWSPLRLPSTKAVYDVGGTAKGVYFTYFTPQAMLRLQRDRMW